MWGEHLVQQVEVAVIGTGWCGGIRAETLARSALVDKLHICEIRPDRLAEVNALTKSATATLDYQDIVKNPSISVVYVCTTPEQNHYPITKDCLRAGKDFRSPLVRAVGSKGYHATAFADGSYPVA